MDLKVMVADSFEPFWARIVEPVSLVVILLAAWLLVQALIRRPAPGSFHVVLIAGVALSLGSALMYHFLVRLPEITKYYEPHGGEPGFLRSAVNQEVGRQVLVASTAVVLVLGSFIIGKRRTRPDI